jgi:hypothetical protein
MLQSLKDWEKGTLAGGIRGRQGRGDSDRQEKHNSEAGKMLAAFASVGGTAFDVTLLDIEGGEQGFHPIAA